MYSSWVGGSLWISIRYKTLYIVLDICLLKVKRGQKKYIVILSFRATQLLLLVDFFLFKLLSDVTCFQPEELLLGFFVKMVLLTTNSLSFCLSGNFLSLLLVLKDSFAGH